MKTDSIKLMFTYVITAAILGGVYYALIISPYTVEADVKLWLTGLAGAAVQFLYGEQVAVRTAHQQTSALNSGLSATPNPTVTATGGDPPTVTVEPTTTVNGGQG